jgi:hypothetical protein
MKKTFIYLFTVLITAFVFSSCRMGLDELPVFQDAKMTNFWLEHREVVKKTYANGQQYEVIVFTDIKAACTFSIVSETAEMADCKVTISQAKVTKTIDLANIVGKATISTAAKIEPLDSSPVLGTPGNYSSQVSYKVTAADNTTVKTYKITVVLQ